MLITRAQGREARDRIGEKVGEAKERKKPQTIRRHDVGNGGDLGERRKKCRQYSIDPVAVEPEYQEISKEAGREAQGTRG